MKLERKNYRIILKNKDTFVQMYYGNVGWRKKNGLKINERKITICHRMQKAFSITTQHTWEQILSHTHTEKYSKVAAKSNPIVVVN